MEIQVRTDNTDRVSADRYNRPICLRVTCGLKLSEMLYGVLDRPNENEAAQPMI